MNYQDIFLLYCNIQKLLFLCKSETGVNFEINEMNQQDVCNTNKKKNERTGEHTRSDS